MGEIRTSVGGLASVWKGQHGMFLTSGGGLFLTVERSEMSGKEHENDYLGSRAQGVSLRIS